MKFAIKVFLGMIFLGTGGTLVKKAMDNAAEMKLKEGFCND